MACPTVAEFEAYLRAFIADDLGKQLTRTIPGSGASEPYWTGVWDGAHWSGARHIARLRSVNITVTKTGEINAEAVITVGGAASAADLEQPRVIKTIRVPLTPRTQSGFRARLLPTAAALAPAPVPGYTPLVHTLAAPRTGRAVAAVARSGSFHPAPATFDPPAPTPAPAHCCCCSKKTA